jgi:SAM-dependent methyltransferase
VTETRTQNGWIPIPVCGCCGDDRSSVAGRAQGATFLRCRGCGTLRFEAVAPSETIYRDGYHTGTSDFGWDYAATAPYEEAMALRRVALIETVRAGGSLIDVGGGLGYLAAAAQRHGWDAELIEPVEQAAEFARAEMRVPASVGGVADLARLGRTFDVVCYAHVLEHIPDAAGALDAARTALRPGGVLFVEVPNFGSLARRLQGDLWLGWQAGEHVYLFTRRTLAGLLRRAGWTTLAMRTFVPTWDGMSPDGNAHMLGLQRAMYGALSVKRRFGGLLRRGSSGGEGSAHREPVPVVEERGPRRLLYGTGFRGLARLESALGVGTNIQVLARPVESG